MITYKTVRHLLKLWFGSIKPNLLVTHSFGPCVTMETGVPSLTRFYDHLQRQVHGRKWNTRVTHKPMILAGMWERLDPNPRFHVVIAGSDEEHAWLFEQGNDYWLTLQPHVPLDFSKIKSRPKVLSYAANNIYVPDSQDKMFLYKSPPSKE